MIEFKAWFISLDPAWCLLVFPLVFGSVAVSCALDSRRAAKKRANPYTMSTDEYRRFNHQRCNRGRFNGK
jgi:hypothetical protein